MTNQNLYQIGLTMINGIGDILGRQLLLALGSAEAVFTEKVHTLEKIPGIGSVLAKEIKRADTLKRAEKELSFIDKNNISIYFLTDNSYPSRLRECADAPLLFYVKGNADLQAQHIISLVGTRRDTDYGRELTEKLICDLAAVFPDLLIISGLAYGIDICSHRNALKYNLPTVAVLAHGLDRIYPPIHRSTAVEMLNTGGLLTDFPSGTNPDKPNFIKRNRIIAGLADATVVIESADKGGSLITADIAFSYGRDVFAFPGKTTDMQSQGCNRLIRENKAGLITCANDLIEAMCWDASNKSKKIPEQAQFIFTENDDTNRVALLLKEYKEMHIDQLSAETNLPVHELSSILFEMEMNGLIKAIPGSMYKWL